MFKSIAVVCAFVSGLAAGVAFVVSCGSGSSDSSPSKRLGPGSVFAQANCAAYEVAIFPIDVGARVPNKIDSGWVPFAVTASYSSVVAARCAQ